MFIYFFKMYIHARLNQGPLSAKNFLAGILTFVFFRRNSVIWT